VSNAFAQRMWANDRPLSDFKVLTGDPHGLNDPPSNQPHLLPVVGRVGALRVSGEGETPSRHFTVEAMMKADSDSEALSLRDAMLRWLTADEVEFRFAAWTPNRVCYGIYESISEEYHSGLYSSWRFTMSFVMPDPLKYNRQVDVYTIPAGSEVALVLGSAPSDVHLQFASTGVGLPRVLYKDAQGFVRGDLSFTLAAADFVVGQWIDWNPDGFQLARRYVLPNTSPVDVPELVPTRLFVADPADGDDTQGPTLTAVGCNITAFVRQAWL
jgi:hypothetical protein